MSGRPLGFIFSLLVSFLFSSGICQAANRYEEEGLSLYKSGNYSEGAKLLRQSISYSPESASAHYLLGNCLLRLNYADEANQEFRTALSLTKDPTLISYCKKALETCLYASAKNKEANTLEGTIRRISNQAFLQKNITEAYVNSSNKTQMDDTAARVRALEKEKDDRIYTMKTRTYSTGKGSTERFYSDEEVQAISDGYDDRIQAMKDSATRISRTFLDASQKANKDLDESARALESNLRLGANVKGERLLPVGTSLYVRNYSVLDVQSQRKPPEQELTATQEMLLLDEHKRHGAFKTTVVPQTSSTGSWRSSTSSVSGKLLNNNLSK